jgi:hypothetical protein
MHVWIISGLEELFIIFANRNNIEVKKLATSKEPTFCCTVRNIKLILFFGGKVYPPKNKQPYFYFEKINF